MTLAVVRPEAPEGEVVRQLQLCSLQCKCWVFEALSTHFITHKSTISGVSSTNRADMEKQFRANVTWKVTNVFVIANMPLEQLLAGVEPMKFVISRLQFMFGTHFHIFRDIPIALSRSKMTVALQLSV